MIFDFAVFSNRVSSASKLVLDDQVSEDAIIQVQLPPEHAEMLSQRLLSLELEDVFVRSDGHCFFRWLCLVLNVDPDTNHLQVRSLLAKFEVRRCFYANVLLIFVSF